MINIRNVYKVHFAYDVQTTALNNINLSIESGEFLTIMGPSGCGKSTLLNVLGLLDTPMKGEYSFNGQNLAGCSESQRADVRKTNIGVIFQSFNLVDELTVYQNVELAQIYQKVPKAERKRRVEEVLERVSIKHRANHYPQQLSGGQQQRVAIARAIVGKPKLLLADEPTGNLDSKTGDEVMHLIEGLNSEGSTVVMVTHSEHHAAYGSRLVRMLDGAIVNDSNMRRGDL